MTMHHDIDKLFKKGLEGYAQKPPSFVWENIDHALNRKRIKQRRNTLYSIAAAVAILLSFGAGYQFNLFNTSNTQLAQQNEQKVIINDDAPESEVNYSNTNDGPEINKAQNLSNDITNKKHKENNTDNKSTKEKPSKKEAIPSEPKAKKVNSSGTLLPPMFASEMEYNEEEQAAPIFIEEEKNQEANEAKLLSMHMNSRTLKSEVLKKDLKYEYREVPMYDETAYMAPKSTSSKWDLAFNAAPLVSFRGITSASSSNDLMFADNTNSYEQGYTNEQPLVSYSVGTNVSYGVSKRWKIQSGVYFSEIGQVSKNIDISSSFNYGANQNFDKYAINTSIGNVNVTRGSNQLLNSLDYTMGENDPIKPSNLEIVESTNNNISTDLIQTMDFIEIPLLVSYKVVDKKLGINVSGGISANILYNNQSYLSGNGNNYNLDADNSDLKSANYNGIVGFGMDYPIFSQLHISLQPTLRYSLSPINNSGTVYPYSFGLYSGLRYSF